MSASPKPWQASAGGDGVSVRVRLTPKSSRDAIEGLEETADGTALKARVRALPENGAANAALERLVADWLGVARGCVTLARGGKSRIKLVVVTGDTTLIAQRIESRLAAFTTGQRGGD